MMERTSVAISELDRLIRETLAACGCPADHAAACADALLYADRAGFGTHGVASLELTVIEPILRGDVNPSARPALLADAPAAALLDARGGLGAVAATEAMTLAIEKARRSGAAVVTVRRSSHFGSAGFYAWKALQADMIGLAMTNLGTQGIARPPGGATRLLGTNPISAAAPADTYPPFLLDMSTTVVATGKIRAAQAEGRQIPPGWLVDEAGNPITDPAAYASGSAFLQLLGGEPETGGYKGYGLALLVDILCGVLSGAAVGPNPEALRAGSNHMAVGVDIGHCLIAINVAAFRPRADFLHGMDSLLDTLLACPPRVDGQPVLYPGYGEARAMARTATHLSLDPRLIEHLNELAVRFGVAPLG